MVNNGGWNKATDAEVTCYLFTASLESPLGGDWTEITLFQAAKQMPQLREALPATPKELSAYQLTELNDLKYKIRNSQIRKRKPKRKENGMPNRKLVMEEHDGSVLVGVLQDNCDPFIKTEKGAIEAVLPNIPDFLKEAQDKWAVSPKNPAYVAPKVVPPAPKPAVKPSTAPKAAELPLLAGTAKAVTPDLPLLAAETKPEAMGIHVPDEGNLSAPAEAPAPEPVAIEATAEDKAPEAAVEITEPQGAPAAVEPEPEAAPAEQAPATDIDAGEFAEVPSQIVPESEVPEEKVEQELPAPQPAQPTPSAPSKPGEYEYFLEDGRGPFESVQASMDELGLDKDNRPMHNRWDRLSTALKEKIQRRPKS